MTITIVGWSTRKRKDTAIVLQGDSFNCSPLFPCSPQPLNLKPNPNLST